MINFHVTSLANFSIRPKLGLGGFNCSQIIEEKVAHLALKFKQLNKNIGQRRTISGVVIDQFSKTAEENEHGPRYTLLQNPTKMGYVISSDVNNLSTTYSLFGITPVRIGIV